MTEPYRRLPGAAGGADRADDDGPLHGAGSGGVLREDGRGMTLSVSTLQRLILSMHERWESIAPETLDTMYGAEDIPSDAVSTSVSPDGVMVALRAGEDGCAEACWREASRGRSPSTTPRANG